jgi:hypothetical protein
MQGIRDLVLLALIAALLICIAESLAVPPQPLGELLQFNPETQRYQKDDGTW